MHNQNENGKNPRMMWMMVLCCALPIVLILIFSFGGKAIGASSWVTYGGIAVMVIAHLFMMGGSHKNNDDKHEITNEDDKNKNVKNVKNDSGHGCCH